MKKLSLVLMLFCSIVAASAFASSGSGKKSPSYNEVVVVNQTYDFYTIYANYRYAAPRSDELNPVGWYGSSIPYNVTFPDQNVCLQIIRNSDRAVVLDSCFAQGIIKIGPYMNSHKLPQITIR